MKTKTQYEPDRKKGKVRPPKIAEFTVSITEGVTERFKVSGPRRGLRCLCVQEGPAELTREVTGVGTRHGSSGRPPLCKTSPVAFKFSSFPCFSRMTTRNLVLLGFLGFFSVCFSILTYDSLKKKFQHN